MAGGPENGRNESQPAQKTQVNGRYDVTVYRIIVFSLGLSILTTGLNMTILTILGKEIPPALTALGGTALGALTGMLANLRTQT